MNMTELSEPKPISATASGLWVRTNPADTAEHLNELPIDDAIRMIDSLPVQHAVEVFDQSMLRRGGKLLVALPSEKARLIAGRIAIDRLADLIRQSRPAARKALIRLIDAKTANTLREILAYPADSAGSIMTTEFVRASAAGTVAEVLEQIRAIHHTRETIYPIYVCDPKTGALLRTVSLRRVISANLDDTILSLAPDRDPIAVTAETDREEVARLISRHDLLAVPVLDKERRILGIVTVDDVIDAIIAESTEDVQRFGGVAGAEGPYLDIGFVGMIKKRAGWLSALFLSEMLTASAMQHFEIELEKAVVLTLFIPLIMSSGGNSGSQATCLLIRALALGQIRLRDWWRVALRELPAGLTLGAILGVVGMVRIAAWQKLGIYCIDRWCWPGRDRNLRVDGRLHVTLHSEAPGVRSGERVGPFCSDLGRRHGPRDLL
jgi:magnesium transporter